MTRWFYLALAFTLVAFGASVYVRVARYDALPERIPTHWNIRGEPDAWTTKEHWFPAFLLLPSLAAAVLLATPLLPWLSPRQFQVQGFLSVYGAVMAAATALLTYLHLVILIGSARTDSRIDAGRWIVGGILLFLAIIASCFPRMERNFWMGVRTPWTLASTQVWHATHRMAAWLLGITGAGGCLAVLLGAPVIGCFIAIIVAAVVSALYSLAYYKWLEARGELGDRAG